MVRYNTFLGRWEASQCGKSWIPVSQDEANFLFTQGYLSTVYK